jgi:hypothetical protein
LREFGSAGLGRTVGRGAASRAGGRDDAAGGLELGRDGWGLALGRLVLGRDGWGLALGRLVLGRDGWGLALGRLVPLRALGVSGRGVDCGRAPVAGCPDDLEGTERACGRDGTA